MSLDLAESQARDANHGFEPDRVWQRHWMVTTIHFGDHSMTTRILRDIGSDAAVVTAAFELRNAVVIFALTTLTLCALAQP